MKRLHKVMDFCIRHQTILGCSIVSLLTAGIEEIFSSVVFKCPCNSWNMVYGCSFLLAPAIVLFLLGFMVNPKTWRLFTGKCKCKCKCKCCSVNDLCCSLSWTRACCCQTLVLTAKALVAPLTWIAAALFGADFYECAASGNSLAARFFCKGNGTDCRELPPETPCNETLSANIPRQWLSLHAQSQVLGWLLIAVSVIVALISKCVRHCCSRVSYRQLRFWKIYSKEEHEVFEKKAKEHATKLAERNTNCFFEATDPAPFCTPSNEDWQKISMVNTFNSQEQCYSMLHKYVNDKLKKGGPDCTDSAKGNEARTSTVSANGNEAGTSTNSANGNEARQAFKGCTETNLVEYCQSFNPIYIRRTLISAHIKF